MATETTNTGRASDKFMLRLPDGMREQIMESAKAAGRSMNAEIVARLERTFFDNENFGEVTLSDLLQKMSELEEAFRTGRVPDGSYIDRGPLDQQREMAKQLREGVPAKKRAVKK